MDSAIYLATAACFAFVFIVLMYELHPRTQRRRWQRVLDRLRERAGNDE